MQGQTTPLESSSRGIFPQSSSSAFSLLFRPLFPMIRLPFPFAFPLPFGLPSSTSFAPPVIPALPPHTTMALGQPKRTEREWTIESIIGPIPAGEKEEQQQKAEEMVEGEQSSDAANFDGIQSSSHCSFRLCTIQSEPEAKTEAAAAAHSFPAAAGNNCSSSSSASFRALLFDGPIPLEVGTKVEIPANQRRFCHQTANRAAANVCSRTGKVLRRIAQGEELVLLLLTEKRPRVNFGLSTEERAQIRASEAGADAGRGFACQRCGKVFSYAYYRDKHLKFTPCVDNGQRRFPCPRCPRSFEKRDRLRIHVLHVHENHRPHRCQLCGKAFSQSSSLNKHLRTHSGERPYQCPHCEKAFTASSILRTHIRQHSGEKPFKCAQCGKTFASHAAHDSHLRRSHQ